MIATLRADIERLDVIEPSRAIVDAAADLAVRHRLRGYDAIQLASALQARQMLTWIGEPSPLLMSSDLELNTSAAAEGLAVQNPDHHP